jgi:signal transduction histidine kinase
VAPAQREAIFAPFHQAQHKGCRPDGVGMGLALCRKIVAAMGGAISVDEARSGGARFTVTVALPLAEAAAARAARR